MYQAAYFDRAHIPDAKLLATRHMKAPGHAKITRALKMYESGSAGTRSFPEDRFDNLVIRSRVPVPEVNVTIVVQGKRIEVDLLWRTLRLCIEIDGPGHDRPMARRLDAQRDALLEHERYRVIRIPTRTLGSLTPNHVRNLVLS